MCSTDTSTNASANDLGLTDRSAGCGCGSHSAEQRSGETATDAVTTEYLVSGMTCSHCVSSVTEELSALEGVTGVSVELTPGGTSRVVVASATEIDPLAVRTAIDEAGYDLVSPTR